jgi:hypothetical protein
LTGDIHPVTSTENVTDDDFIDDERGTVFSLRSLERTVRRRASEFDRARSRERPAEISDRRSDRRDDKNPPSPPYRAP